MRHRWSAIMVVLLLALAVPAMPVSANPGSATMKFEGSDSSYLIWDLNTDLFLPATPYVSNSSTALASKVYITLHDSTNYNYWVRFGFCYGNGAYETQYPNSHCDAYYNVQGSGKWVPFVELNNQYGNSIYGIPDYASSGSGFIIMGIEYASGDQYTEFDILATPIYQVQTFFSRDGFMPINTGGYASVANANPANGDAVWIGGLGSSNAAVFNNNGICSTLTGHTSQGCANSYWYSGFPVTTNPNTCPSPCPYSDSKATGSNNRYFFNFWTKTY